MGTSVGAGLPTSAGKQVIDKRRLFGHLADMDPTDNAALARAAQGLAAVLATATDKGWLTSDEARALMQRVLGSPSAAANRGRTAHPTKAR